MSHGYVVASDANLWAKPQYRDIALRDVGLALSALALGQLAADVAVEGA